MNGKNNNKHSEQSGGKANTFELQRLLEQIEESQTFLLKAVAEDNRELVSEYDDKFAQSFDRLLDLKLKNDEDRLLVLEFLLNQLNIENSPMNDRISSRIVAILRESFEN